MAEYEEFEEEEFTTQFNGGTLARILGQLKPHWRWVAGFMVSIALVSSLDSVFTYQSKRIIDEAIVPQNPAALGIALRPWQEAVAEYVRTLMPEA